MEKNYIIYGYSISPYNEKNYTHIYVGKFEDYKSEKGFEKHGVCTPQSFLFMGNPKEIELFKDCDFTFGVSQKGTTYVKEINYI